MEKQSIAFILLPFAFGVLACLPLKSYGQQVFTAKEIQLSEKTSSDLGQEKGNFTAFKMDAGSLSRFIGDRDDNIVFTLQLGTSHNWTFQFQRRNINAKGCSITVHTKDGEISYPAGKSNTFIGRVGDRKSDRAFMVVGNSYLQGYFYQGEKYYEIKPLVVFDKTAQKDVFILTAMDKEFSLAKTESPDPNCSGGGDPDCGVNNNNICDTEPLFDNNWTYDYPILELAADADAGFYTKFKTGTDHPNFPGLDEGVVSQIQSMIGGKVSSAYLDYFDLIIHIVHYNIWTEENPDNYDGSSHTSLMNSLLNYWINNKDCIHRDVVHLFTDKSTGVDGKTLDDACTEDAYSFSRHVNTLDYDSRERIVGHELGHHLNAAEDEGTTCCSLCEINGNTPLMCQTGFGGPWEFIFSEQSQCKIHTFIYGTGHIECFTGSVGYQTGCERCVPLIEVTSDTPHPIVGCDEKDIIEYKIKICNDCYERTTNVEVFGNFTSQELIFAGDPPYVFQGPFSEPPSLNKRLVLEDVFFEGEECKTFTFKTRLVENDENFSFSVYLPQIPGNHSTNFKIFPIAQAIGQDGETTSLQELINTGAMNYVNFACDPAWFAKKKFRIRGTLLIDVPYCLSGYNLVMEAGSEIVINPGIDFTIKENTRISGCNEMWKSITVEPGAVLLVDNSVIEDAQYAVNAYGGDSHLSITNSEFNRNFVGIYVHGPEDGLPNPTTFDAFYNNTFDGGEELLPPYPFQSSAPAPVLGTKSYAGLWVKTWANTIHSLENVFTNMSNGIYTNQTNLKVTKNNFTEIRENGYPDWTSGFGILARDYFGSTNFQMTGCGFGDGDGASISLTSKAVRIEGMRVDYISNNVISADRGIELLNNTGKVGVSYNTIRAWKKNGIELSHTDPAATVFIDQNNIIVYGEQGVGIKSNMMGLPPASLTGFNLLGNFITLKNNKTSGIELVSNNSVMVASNYISAETGLSGFRGIKINNDNGSILNCNKVETDPGTLDKTIGINTWDGENTQFHCNKVINMQRGMTFQMGSTSPENIQETTFSGNEVGLMLTASAALGPQTHRGNKWTGTFGGYGAQHGSNEPLVWFQSQFTVNTFTPGTYRPTLPVGQNDWFKFDPAGSPSNACQTSNICPIFPAAQDGGLFEIDTKIADGTFQSGEFPQEMGWLARRYLYRKLVNNPTLITGGSPLETFYNAIVSQVIGSFYNIETGMADLLDMSAETVNQLAVNFDTISLGMDELGIMDSLLLTDGSNGTIQNQRVSTVQLLSGKTQSNTGLMETVLAQRETDADLVADQNENILTTLTLEANERAVNEIYLATVAKGILQFDSIHLVNLHSIAKQCPLSGGSAVFKARSLLAMVEDSVFDDETICESVEGRQALNRGADIDHQGSFSLIPNPARQQVTVFLTGKLNILKEIVFFDSFGRDVLRREVPAGAESLTLDISSLKDGMYFCRLLEDNKQIYAQKLVIVK